MADQTTTSAVDRARQALERHEWRTAFDLLSEADARGELPDGDLELLAEAAWWNGRLPLAIEVRERAYAAAVRAGESRAAVKAAIGLARDNLVRLNTSVADAWMKRADRLLEGQPEGPAHGWLAAGRAFRAALTGDIEEGLREAERAQRIGTETGDRNLEAMALGERAALLIATGRVEEGLPLADEATLVAVSGELDPSTAGGVCCATIEACAGIGDLKRAAEWTEAQDRWCRREGINGYPGMCRLFRSDIKRIRGSWSDAEAEARVASDELRGYIPAGAGLALNLIGQIRLSRGDLPAAEEALLGAHALGTDTEPAFSLLRLAQGRVRAALESIRRAIDEPNGQSSWQAPPDSEASRLRMLPARVEIALAAGETDEARAAAEELARLAERFRTSAARGTASTAAGLVANAEGDAHRAQRELRDAVARWTEVDAPYDAARARAALGDAYLAVGDADRAAIELRTARDAFERLGAAPDLRRTEDKLAELQASSGIGPMGMAATRATRAFMFTDIVDSTRLAQALGDEAWEGLRGWHDRTLRAAAAEQAGEEVKATGDGFFFAFGDPDQAIEAAIGMQRRLAAHRATEGFAPEVRIGIHQAEASRVGLDYHGIGVNLASRIGDAGGAGEVLVSAATLASTRHQYAERGRRTEQLKGIVDPVEVVSVDWR
ncbi:MAG TPA: adenylate/guanylate cyclase domain-containing protein [Candidatus Limnocylindria bacterium]